MENNPLNMIKDVGRRAALWVPLMAVAALSSCTSDDSVATPSQASPNSYLRINASVDDNWQEVTRGERIERELEQSFGLFAYTYGKDDDWWNYYKEVTWKPNMLCDQEVSMVPEGWATTSLITLPSETGAKMQFFAYYPYRDPEMASEEYQFLTRRPQWDPEANDGAGDGTPGNPVFGFKTADNAKDQLDFMVGVSSVYTRPAPNKVDEFFGTPVKIRFRHMLAGVIFKVGSEFTEPMTINSIRITKVAKEATLTVAPPNADAEDYDAAKPYDTATYEWADLGSKGSVTVTPNFEVKKIVPNADPSKTDVGKMMNADDEVMFLIPQILSPEDDPATYSTLEITVNDNVNLSVKLGQTELKRGKITVFNISVKSLAKIALTTQVIDWNSSEENIFGGSAQEGNAILPNSAIDDWTDYDSNAGLGTILQQETTTEP